MCMVKPSIYRHSFCASVNKLQQAYSQSLFKRLEIYLFYAMMLQTRIIAL